jgi:hypothetical protein
MKSTATSTLALLTAVMVSAMVAGPALAQDDATDGGGTEFGTDAEVSTLDADDQGLEADAADELFGRTGMTEADLLAALQATPGNVAGIDALSNLSAGGEVHIIAISDLQGEQGENAAALSQALAANQATLPDLQAAVDANATARNALREMNFLPANVVAVHPIEDGRLIVVVDESPV